MTRKTLGALAAPLLVPGMAAAHPDVGGALMGGLAHPFLGPDHVAAMVAVGLWGALLGRPALWLLPLGFPVAMALGGALAAAGVPLPGEEAGVALSGIGLGLLVALGVRLPLGAAGALVALVALVHGHAHGVALPQAAEPLAHAAGLLAATGLLGLMGAAIGAMSVSWGEGQVVRALGGGIALAGGAFLTGIA